MSITLDKRLEYFDQSGMLLKTLLETIPNKIHRKKHEYGVSGVYFCALSQKLRRLYPQDDIRNGNMVMGTISHEYFLPKFIPNLVKRIAPELIPPNWKFWKSVDDLIEYEKEIHMYIESDYGHEIILTGHIDAVIPKLDTIIEFKTTGQIAHLLKSTYIQVYLMQANMYAIMDNRKYWIILILGKQFDNIIRDKPIYLLWDKTEPSMKESFIQHVKFIDESMNSDVIIEPSPAFAFECRYCPFLVEKCPKMAPVVQAIHAFLPCTKRQLIERIKSKNFDLIFDSLKSQGLIGYDRSRKLWMITEKLQKVLVK